MPNVLDIYMPTDAELRGEGPPEDYLEWAGRIRFLQTRAEAERFKLNKRAAKHFGPPAVNRKKAEFQPLDREIAPEEWNYFFRRKLHPDVRLVLGDVFNRGYFRSDGPEDFYKITRTNKFFSDAELGYRMYKVSPFGSDEPRKYSLFVVERDLMRAVGRISRKRQAAP